MLSENFANGFKVFWQAESDWKLGIVILIDIFEDSLYSVV